jgi:hypothetical protein
LVISMDLFIIQALTELGATGLDENGLDAMSPSEHTSLASLREWAKATEGSVGLIYIGVPDVGMDDVNVFTFSEGQTTHMCYIITLKHTIVMDNQELANVLVLAGTDLFGPDIAALPFPDNVTIKRNPALSFPFSSLASTDLGGADAVIENRVITAVCKDEQLLSWLEMTNVTTQEGLMACLYAMYPFMRSWLRERTTAVDYSVACRKKGDVNAAVFAGTRENKDIIFRVRTIIYLLGPSYSRESKIASQIQKRGQAASQSLGLDFPTAEDVAAQISATNWTVGDRTGLMDDALGALLARTETMEINHEVQLADLIPVQHLIDNGQVTAWGGAVLVQARMVYEQAHAKTLTMAMSVEPLVKALLRVMADPWNVEIARVSELIESVKGRPYTGLRANLPDLRQIAKWPRVGLLGLLHHRNTLETEQKKTEFDAYNIAGVEDKIDSAQDKQTCRSIIDTIPATNILGLTAVVGGVHLAAARNVMDSKSPSVKGGVLKRLISTGINCQWRDFYYNELVKKEMKRIRDQAVTLVENILKDKMRNMRTMADNESDPVVARQKRTEIGAFEAQISDDLRGGNPIRDTVPSPDEAAMQSEYRNEIERLEMFIMRIKGFNYTDTDE